MRLFGFEFVRSTPNDIAPSFAPKEVDDGAVIVAAGGAYGTYIDLDGTVRTEAELVTKYREMALQPEIDAAVDEIVNESISIDEDDIVNIVLDNLEVTEKTKKAIREEFKNILNILNFQKRAYEIYRRWYIDGRLYYHILIDEKDVKSGIKELRYVDPRKIRKIREVGKRRVPGGISSDAVIPRVQNEYFIFNDKGFNYGNKVVGPTTAGLKIAKDSIVHVTSGLTDTQGTMVLSYLHKAIKALNQLRTLEDALVIYRLARAPERRIWYIDVGNLPKMKAEQYVRDIMIKHKNRLIYDAASGEVRDDRKFMCYAMDTKIPLLDGRTLELQEIIEEYKQGKTNWVYSCDPVTGKFYPGPVSWAGITKTNAEVVRVTFDNGKSVVCTPDHKFPVWGKGFVEAQHLTPEDSIIPGYRRFTKDSNNTSVEYEQIYKNETGKWEFTHREVASWKKEVNLHEELTYDDSYTLANKSVIHHRDYNGRNNNPENLVYMNHKDHMLLHKNEQNVEYPVSIINHILESVKSGNINTDLILENINMNETLMAEWENLNHSKHAKNKTFFTFTYKDLSRICKSFGFKGWRDFRNNYEPYTRNPWGGIRKAKSVRGSIEWRESLSESAKNRTKVSCKSWKITLPSGETEIIENLNSYCRDNNLNRSNIKGQFGSKGYHAEQLRNHRIVSVEKLDERMVVGSMSIDTEETYHSHHTYLLDAGVYTKNTMLEDYWLPRREGGKGTEVTTLPGGQTLGEMDDVLYFQKKLYGTLNVPVNRLNSDALFSIGRATEVTRDEVKFSKFVNRLRGRFAHLFTSLLEKQLVLKGIMSIEDWNNIAPDIRYDFARDNYFTELKDADVLQNRIQLYSAFDQNQLIGKYFSHEYVRKNVFKQSDDKIEEMDEEIAEEEKDPRWNMSQLEPGADDFTQPGDDQGQGSAPQDEPQDDDKNKIVDAQKTVDRLSKLSKRSIQDESKYRSAIQILARNKGGDK